MDLPRPSFSLVELSQKFSNFHIFTHSEQVCLRIFWENLSFPRHSSTVCVFENILNKSLFSRTFQKSILEYSGRLSVFLWPWFAPWVHSLLVTSTLTSSWPMLWPHQTKTLPWKGPDTIADTWSARVMAATPDYCVTFWQSLASCTIQWVTVTFMLCCGLHGWMDLVSSYFMSPKHHREHSFLGLRPHEGMRESGGHIGGLMCLRGHSFLNCYWNIQNFPGLSRPLP